MLPQCSVHVQSDWNSGLNWSMTTGGEVIKLFSSSSQLSMKFYLLKNFEIVKISGKLRFRIQKN